MPVAPPGSAPLLWEAACDDENPVSDGKARLAASLRETRRLAGRLGLPAPRTVEVAPVPDQSAGMTFAGIIRLQPAPPTVLHATLLHETGHLGPFRQREVEEAIADLTRRALLSALAKDSPQAAAPLLPALVSGLYAGATPVPPSRGNAPLSPAVYREASRLALALLVEVGLSDAARPRTAREAVPYADAARLGRTLTSTQVRRLAEDHLAEPAAAAAAGAALRLDVVARLREAAATGAVNPAHRRLCRHLALALEAAGDTRTGESPLRGYLDTALELSDGDRIMAHGVVVELASSPEVPLAYLTRWLERAEGLPDPRSACIARSRRAMARLQDADRAGARADLARVAFECPDPVLAAAALVEWSFLEHLAPDDVERLLDLSPTLSRCGAGAGAEAMRAHTLALAGAAAEALPHFARAAAVTPGWSLTVGWAEAMAAAGRRSSAAALFRREARTWQLQAGGEELGGAALLAATLIDPGGGPEDPLAAADLLLAGGGWPDQALAEAAARLSALGREREALLAWRRLLDTVPLSDLAPLARERLRRAAGE